MLKIKGWLRAAALTLVLCLLLTGCSFPMQETMQVEELLRAPRLAGDYGALQTALNDWLGESAQLKYPMQGDLLSPFVLQDFDGDGQQDAAVFYTTALTSNVCVAFLRKNSEGSWQVSQPAGAASGGRHGPAGGGLYGFAGGSLSGGLFLRERRGVGHPRAGL